MTKETRVKICGITSPEDATLSFGHGADYLGLVFADSPRRVPVETALHIRRAVPEATLVGVFVDAPLSEIVTTSRNCSLDMVQLHGHETPGFCNHLHSLVSLPIIKSIGWSCPADTMSLSRFTRASYFLFDLGKDRGAGEPGPKQVNGDQKRLWQHATRARRQGFRIFLAGALDVTNVIRAVHAVSPYCVDATRGVEKSPGVKDPAKLEEFIKEVKA